jgi:antitoxin (DNA-binding transcriptional repressor) of toxin-antitoxin stability system
MIRVASGVAVAVVVSGIVVARVVMARTAAMMRRFGESRR